MLSLATYARCEITRFVQRSGVHIIEDLMGKVVGNVFVIITVTDRRIRLLLKTYMSVRRSMQGFVNNRRANFISIKLTIFRIIRCGYSHINYSVWRRPGGRIGTQFFLVELHRFIARNRT